MLYDIVIIGAAPAGLTAALYAARQGNSVLVLEKGEPGGQAIKTTWIENYPGADPEKPSQDLINMMVKQAEMFGAEIRQDEVVRVDLKGPVKEIQCLNESYQAKAVIIATGAFPRKLNVPGEEEYTGKGVGYCATCDAPFFQDMDVYVVGGGNSAIDEALYLTKFARRVTLVVRDKVLNCDHITQKRAKDNEKIRFWYNKSIVEFKGSGLLNEMIVEDRETKERFTVRPEEGDMTFGVFIFIGNLPNTELFKSDLALDDYGYIPTDEDMRTSIDRVYAAGDCRQKNLRQAITAASDGAIAAHFAGKDLDQ